MKKILQKTSCYVLVLIMAIAIIPPLPANAATKLSRMSGKQIMKTLVANGFPIDDYKVYTTNRADPNHLIGKPRQYKCKIDFWDKDYFDEYFADDYSGTIEIFKNTSDATKRKKYLKSMFDAVPSWAQRMYQYSNILVRIDYGVPGKRVNYYKKAFSDMSKGKTPKYPLSISNKKLTLVQGKTKTLKLNVAASKAKWSTSKKSVATVSKTGKITAKKPGKTVIKAKYNGYTVKCTVTVIKKQSVKDLTTGIAIQTVNWGEYWNSVSFKIKNSTVNDIAVSGTLTAYDDDYEYLGQMEIYSDSETITSGSETTVTFLDFTFSDMIYYSQRLKFEIKTSSRTLECTAEYSYNDSVPYKFAFK